MGILDDAIREHLDLKRRRGADPSEVERLEREALGPVRRGPHDHDESVLDPGPSTASAYLDESGEDWAPAPDEAPRFDEAAEYEPPPALDHQAEHAAQAPLDQRAEYEAPLPFDHQTEPEVPSPPDRQTEPDTPRHHEIAEEWHAHESQAVDSGAPGLEPDAHAPVAPPPAGPASAPADHLDVETAEFDVEAEEFEEPEGEDVLEETPEFLQDTPDHDRLWFEQRPPRDFDFDS